MLRPEDIVITACEVLEAKIRNLHVSALLGCGRSMRMLEYEYACGLEANIRNLHVSGLLGCGR